MPQNIRIRQPNGQHNKPRVRNRGGVVSHGTGRIPQGKKVGGKPLWGRVAQKPVCSPSFGLVGRIRSTIKKKKEKENAEEDQKLAPIARKKKGQGEIFFAKAGKNRLRRRTVKKSAKKTCQWEVGPEKDRFGAGKKGPGKRKRTPARTDGTMESEKE